MANTNSKAAQDGGGRLLLLQEVDDLVAFMAARDVDPVDVAVAERSNSESLKCGDKK